jgi:hypothetical protein
MSDFFKGLIKEAKEKIEGDKAESTSSAKSDDTHSDRDRKAQSDRVKNALDKLNEDGSTAAEKAIAGKAAADASRSAEASDRARAAERAKQDRERNRDETKLATKLNPLSNSQKAILLQSFLQDSIDRVLSNYTHQEKLMTALGQLKTSMQTLYSENPSFDFLVQMARQVETLRESLELAQLTYKKLEDLGLSMLASGDAGSANVSRKLKFLDQLLTELQKKGKISLAETDVLNRVRRLLQAMNASKNPTDRQLGEAFVAQLTGPLSRRVILKTYEVPDVKEGLDWARLAADLKSGKLDDLLIYQRLSPYMKMLLNSKMAPKDSKAPNGEKVTISENTPELELALELDRFNQFYRDGAPVNVDLLRFITGDMLENTYFLDRNKPDPKTLKPRKVSIVIYDISGSMGSQNKYVLRNALVTSYVDASQKDVLLGKEDHIVYTMAFDGAPHAPERMGTIQEAMNYFEKSRATPIRYGGNDSITEAVARVFEIIAENEKSGGALNRANILLITDAVAPVDFKRIEDARKLVSDEVDIRFNAISMGDLNNDVKKLVELQGGEGKGKLGVVSHQHINYETIAEILNSKARLEVISDVASTFDNGQDSAVGREQLVRLKNDLVAAEEFTERRDQSLVVTNGSLLREITIDRRNEGDSEVEILFKPFFRLALSSVSMPWATGQRLEALRVFVGMVAKETNVSEAEVLQRLSTESREKVKAWLGY